MLALLLVETADVGDGLVDDCFRVGGQLSGGGIDLLVVHAQVLPLDIVELLRQRSDAIVAFAPDLV